MTGLIHVYTGNGKGKTTSALGLCFRALGRGFEVYFIQFMKGDAEYGELRSARVHPGMHVKQFGTKEFIQKGNPSEEDIRLAHQGMEYAEEIMEGVVEKVRGGKTVNEKLTLMVLDELNVAVDFGLVTVKEVMQLLRRKPSEMELVITGRGAPEEIVDQADYVTEMKEIKHPYQQGVVARKGIEY